MAWRRGTSQIGARRDAIQSGEVAVETLATGRTHEREELMAGARARALGGRDETAGAAWERGDRAHAREATEDVSCTLFKVFTKTKPLIPFQNHLCHHLEGTLGH